MPLTTPGRDKSGPYAFGFAPLAIRQQYLLQVMQLMHLLQIRMVSSISKMDFMLTHARSLVENFDYLECNRKACYK